MFSSYLRLALRNLLRNRLYAFINIIGLSVAIALCITAYVNYQFSESFDSFHKNSDQIYRVKSRILNKDRLQDWGIVPAPLSELIAAEISGINKTTRFAGHDAVVRYGEKVFNEGIAYADDDFLRIFSFPLIAGEADVLDDKNSMVISADIAKKYFGDQSPLGKQMNFHFDGKKTASFFVGAVVENIPLNSSFQFDILLPFSQLQEVTTSDLTDWKSWTRVAMVQVKENSDVAEIESQLQSYVLRQNEANEEFRVQEFYLDPLRDLAKNSIALRGDSLQEGLPMPALVGPSVAALLILLMACFNYVNTALAYSSRRLKEIGIRKVIGGVRRQLVVQFLGENLVLCFIALLVGFGLSELFVPAYDSLWPNISLSINLTDNLDLVFFLIATLLFTAIAAGAYPALYISSYNPVNIFRGKQRLGGRNGVIRLLLTMQFALSMIGIISALVMNKNSDFIQNFDPGFDKDQVVVIPVDGQDEFEVFRNAISNDPRISEVGASRNRVGASWFTTNVEVDAKITELRRVEIGENYLATVGLEIVQGRTFNEKLQTDTDGAVLINETFAREFNWTNPLEKHIKIQDKEYAVIGVVRDFHYNGIWRKIAPLILNWSTPNRINYASVKCGPNSVKETVAYLKTTWKQVFPHKPFEVRFQDENLGNSLRVTESIRMVSTWVAILAILISATGLFALVSLSIAKRTKEIGIRKILGASLVNIVRLMSNEFTLLLAIATIVATVSGYFMMDSLLKSIYAYYVDFGTSPFALASVLVVAVSLLTVSSQVYRVAVSNPVRALRDE